MKKVSAFKAAKAAILSEMEQSVLNGGRVVCGANTAYYGPDNPSSISTYVDGFPAGEDGTSGSGWGDTWATYLTAAPSGSGRFVISRG